MSWKRLHSPPRDLNFDDFYQLADAKSRYKMEQSRERYVKRAEWDERFYSPDELKFTGEIGRVESVRFVVS